jgi:hypothetical protein
MQTYAYLHESAVHESAVGRTLAPETSGGATPAGETANPRFFEGFLTAPDAAAAALLTVADVAAARYYQPRPAGSLDPVVTAGGDPMVNLPLLSTCGPKRLRSRCNGARKRSAGLRPGQGR